MLVLRYPFPFLLQTLPRVFWAFILFGLSESLSSFLTAFFHFSLDPSHPGLLFGLLPFERYRFLASPVRIEVGPKPVFFFFPPPLQLLILLRNPQFSTLVLPPFLFDVPFSFDFLIFSSLSFFSGSGHHSSSLPPQVMFSVISQINSLMTADPC